MADRVDEIGEKLRLNKLIFNTLTELRDAHEAQDDDEAVLKTAKRCMAIRYSFRSRLMHHHNRTFLGELHRGACVVFLHGRYARLPDIGASEWWGLLRTARVLPVPVFLKKRPAEYTDAEFSVFCVNLKRFLETKPPPLDSEPATRAFLDVIDTFLAVGARLMVGSHSTRELVLPTRRRPSPIEPGRFLMSPDTVLDFESPMTHLQNYAGLLRRIHRARPERASIDAQELLRLRRLVLWSARRRSSGVGGQKNGSDRTESALKEIFQKTEGGAISMFCSPVDYDVIMMGHQSKRGCINTPALVLKGSRPDEFSVVNDMIQSTDPEDHLDPASLPTEAHGRYIRLFLEGIILNKVCSDTGLPLFSRFFLGWVSDVTHDVLPRELLPDYSAEIRFTEKGANKIKRGAMPGVLSLVSLLIVIKNGCMVMCDTATEAFLVWLDMLPSTYERQVRACRRMIAEFSDDGMP